MIKTKIKVERVKEILLRRNITQNNLASRLGISSGYCSQLLSGRRCPSPSLRARLMHELKTDFDALFEPINVQEEAHTEEQL